MVTKTPDVLRDLVQRIVVAVGTDPDDAAIVTKLLVDSHLAGHDSHGVQHLPRYILEVQAGEIVPSARPEIMADDGSVVRVRGNWAWGHVVTDFALGIAIERAKRHGIALVGIVETNHIGRLGDYVERAAAEGVVAFLFNGGGGVDKPSAVPYGGRDPVFSPNPIAIGSPTATGPPIVYDIATTEVAGGKVALAEAKGERIPEGWIIDKDGNPTTDPSDLGRGGAYLPFGKHKGFGIMFLLDVLGRILAGGDSFSGTSHGGVHFRHHGTTFITIDSGAFESSELFAQRVTELVDRTHASSPAEGFTEVLVPGDFEHRSRAERERTGIQIPDSTWQALMETAESLGVGV